MVGGGAPAHEVLRDDAHVAFLDTAPLFRGHVLLVPTVHVTTLRHLPSERAGAFLQTAQRLAVAVEEGLGADGSLVIINNVVSQSVPHLHLHVIPRRRGDGLRRWLGPRSRYADDADAAGVTARVRQALPPA